MSGNDSPNNNQGQQEFGRSLSHRHPDGVGELIFQVADIETTLRVLEAEATPVENITTIEEEGGTYRSFAITTPFGSSLFHFVQRTIIQPIPRM